MQLKYVVEAALLAAGRPLSIDELRGLLGSGDDAPSRQELREAIDGLAADYAPRGIRLHEVASGFRVQVDPSMSGWLGKLWEGRPPRYSRALLETLAIIAYRQPVTRGEVEDIRGVTVTTQIMRTLLERGWVRVVGHRDVPGKPAMYGTTRDFLDYFGLKSLDELPSLAELKDLDALSVQLELPDAEMLSADLLAAAAEDGEFERAAADDGALEATAGGHGEPEAATAGHDEGEGTAGQADPVRDDEASAGEGETVPEDRAAADEPARAFDRRPAAGTSAAAPEAPDPRSMPARPEPTGEPGLVTHPDDDEAGSTLPAASNVVPLKSR